MRILHLLTSPVTLLPARVAALCSGSQGRQNDPTLSRVHGFARMGLVLVQQRELIESNLAYTHRWLALVIR